MKRFLFFAEVALNHRFTEYFRNTKNFPEYRYAVCNINWADCDTIPVVFQNLLLYTGLYLKWDTDHRTCPPRRCLEQIIAVQDLILKNVFVFVLKNVSVFLIPTIQIHYPAYCLWQAL